MTQQVNSVTYRGNKQEVALKVADDLPITKTELTALTAVAGSEPRSAHVIRVYDFWIRYIDKEVISQKYIKMEFCHGTLHEYLIQVNKNGQTLDSIEITEIMLHIISGVSHCHDRHVVHRDLKLANGTP